jgi:hypothetical protein
VIVARCTIAPPDEPSWSVRTHRQATADVEEGVREALRLGGIRSTGGGRRCQGAAMTDASVRQVITELFAGQGWPDGGDELLRRSLGPRSPELLLDAPGWSQATGAAGGGAGQLGGEHAPADR